LILAGSLVTTFFFAASFLTLLTFPDHNKRGAIHLVYRTSPRFLSTQAFHSSQLARHRTLFLLTMANTTAAIVWYVRLRVLSPIHHVR
jgi:hypothetical protein